MLVNGLWGGEWIKSALTLSMGLSTDAVIAEWSDRREGLVGRGRSCGRGGVGC